MPGQEMVRSIKLQQRSLSRERERMIQGIQERADNEAMAHGAAMYSVLSGFGEENVEITPAYLETVTPGMCPRTSIQFGISSSFLERGRHLAELYTLNRRQMIAF